MNYEQSLSALKARLGPGKMSGSALRSIDYAARLTSAGNANDAPDEVFHASEVSAGTLIARMWSAGIPDEIGRDFPTFRVGGFDAIIADGPVSASPNESDLASFGGYYVTSGLPEPLRDFIITACNAYRDPVREPEPWGWYAGMPGTGAQSIGPFTSREDAVKGWRADHAVEAFDVFEARRAAGTLAPFTFRPRLRSLLGWINEDNAPIGGVLPLLFDFHEDDLAARLDDAVERWAAENKLRFVTASFAEVRNVERVPEVERRASLVDLDRMNAPIRAACDLNGKRWRVEGPGWTMQPEGMLTVAEAKAICEAAVSGIGKSTEIKIDAAIEIRRTEARPAKPCRCALSGELYDVKDGGCEACDVADKLATSAPRLPDFPPNPPARPHTGDMRAMLDDIGRIDLSGLRAAEVQGWDGATVSPVS